MVCSHIWLDRLTLPKDDCHFFYIFLHFVFFFLLANFSFCQVHVVYSSVGHVSTKVGTQICDALTTRHWFIFFLGDTFRRTRAFFLSYIGDGGFFFHVQPMKCTTRVYIFLCIHVQNINNTFLHHH
jgi:hypothetical protein